MGTRLNKARRDAIREQAKLGYTQAELCQRFRVSRSTVHRAIHGVSQAERARNARLAQERFPAMDRTIVCPRCKIAALTVVFGQGCSVTEPVTCPCCYREGRSALVRFKREPRRRPSRPMVATFTVDVSRPSR
jgi:hypothetical protein